MVKRCIGIDIGSSYVRAVQVRRAQEKFCIEKTFSTQMRRTSDSPPGAIRSLIAEHGFDRHADVAVSMPYDAVFFRNLRADSDGLEQILKHGPSVLEHNFPIPPEELLVRVCSHFPLPNKKYSVLVAATAKESLHERLNTLAEAKMHPALAETAILAVHAAAALNHPEVITGSATIAYINESCITLAVTQNNNILIIRNIPTVPSSGEDSDAIRKQIAELLSREVQITWQKIFRGHSEQNPRIYLAAQQDISNELKTAIEQNLDCQAVIVNPCARVKALPECKTDSTICVAEGLAIRALAHERAVGINFLEADNADVEPPLDIKKEITTCGILILAIAAVYLVGLFMRLSHLETAYARVKNQTTEVFQNALPQEQNIVNPLVQLEQKLQSFQVDYTLLNPTAGTGIDPLGAFYIVTTGIPSNTNISINNILITPESVRLTGVAESFESVYDWQHLLEQTPQFSDVEVRDVRREPKSKLVQFTFSISLATPEQTYAINK